MGVRSSLGVFDALEDRIKSELGGRVLAVERGTMTVVLFGVFLVAAALLAGFITTLFVLLHG